MKFELLSRKVELRANNDNDSMTVSGYVNKTGELSEVLGSERSLLRKLHRVHLLELCHETPTILTSLLNITANIF